MSLIPRTLGLVGQIQYLSLPIHLPWLDLKKTSFTKAFRDFIKRGTQVSRKIFGSSICYVFIMKDDHKKALLGKKSGHFKVENCCANKLWICMLVKSHLGTIITDCSSVNSNGGPLS